MTPAVAVVLGFLTGSGGLQVAGVTINAASVEGGAMVAFEDVRASCPLALPAMNYAAARWPKRKGIQTIARMTRALCAAVQQPDTPVNQAIAVAAVIAALKAPASSPSMAPAIAHNRKR